MVPARVSLDTLGVSDIARSRAFYRALGWGTGGDMEEFTVFRTGGSLLALYPIGEPADPDGHAWEVAHNPGWPLGADNLPQLPQLPHLP